MRLCIVAIAAAALTIEAAALAAPPPPPRPLKRIDLGDGKSVHVVAAWPCWPAAIGFARVVARCPSLVAGKRVIELGCGLGAVGLAAAGAGAADVLACGAPPSDHFDEEQPHRAAMAGCGHEGGGRHS